MGPKKLKGFKYSPVAFQPVRDPWAQLKAQQAQQNKPKKGRYGFLSSIISELSGAGGAAGGAAAGATAGSVVPGLGTLVGGIIGAGIGGFAGGTVGRGVENKVRDNQNFFGAGGSARSALGEGALSGALGSLGTGFSAVRGLKAAGGLNELKALSGGSNDVLKASSKAILRGGKKAGLTIAEEGINPKGLTNVGTRLESRALGFGQGEKLSGQQVKPKDIKELFGVMKSEGIKAGHPDKVGLQVESKLAKLGEGIDSALTKANRPLTKAEQNYLQKGFSREISDNIVLSNNPTAQKLAARFSDEFGNISSLEDIVKGRRNIQKAINFARNSTAATPGTEEVLQAAQKNLNKLAGSISPELKSLNGRFAGLSRLQEATLSSSKNLTAQSRSAMAGLTGALKAGDTATALKASLGSAGRNVGGTLDTLGGGLAGRIAKAGAVRGVANNALMPSAPIEEELPPEDQQLSDAYDQASGGMDTMQAPQTAPVTLQEALMQAQQLLGNDATPAQYLSYAKAIMDTGGGGGGNLDAVAKRQMANLDSATSIVSQLKDLYDNAGGAQGFGGYLTKLTSKTPLNSAQKSYTDQRGAYVSRIVRALGEVGTLNEGDIQRAVALIPDYTDTPESAESKWNGLMQVLNGTRQSIQSAGGSTQPDLASALSQLQGAY